MRRRSGGFSLIELIFVLVLLATVAGIVGVRLGAGFNHDRLTAAARDVAATIRLARDRAQLSGRQHRVIFDLVGRSMRVELLDDPLDAPDDWSGVPQVWGRTRVFALPIRFSEVILDPDNEEPTLFDAESADAVMVVLDPEGMHWLAGDAVDDLDVEPQEGLAVQIQLHGGEKLGSYYVRIEETGTVRVWTEAQKKEYEEQLAGAPTSFQMGAGS